MGSEKELSVTKKTKKNKAQGGITLNEFAEHFAEIVAAIDKGEVQGIAIAVVTADRPNSNRFSTMRSILVKGGGAALFLRDTTMSLMNECEDEVQKQLIAPCFGKSARRPEN